MEDLKDTFPTVALIAGILAVVIGFHDSTPGWAGLPLILGGLLLIYFWETTPWSLHRDLGRICRRLDLPQVEILQEVSSGEIVAVAITKEGITTTMVAKTVKEKEE